MTRRKTAPSGERLRASPTFALAFSLDGRPYVGELTFTPSAGFHTLDPDRVDFELGRLWRKPRSPRFPATPRPAHDAVPSVAPEASESGVLARTGGRSD